MYIYIYIYICMYEITAGYMPRPTPTKKQIWQTDRQKTDSQPARQTDSQPDSQPARQTASQTDRVVYKAL